MWPTYFIPNAPQQGYYLTTPLYPIEVTESMSSSGTVTKGFQWNVPIDNMDSTAELTGGTLRTLLLTGYAGPDSMESTAEFTGGVLDTVLIIIYDNWQLIADPDESMKSTAQLTGGSLT